MKLKFVFSLAFLPCHVCNFPSRITLRDFIEIIINSLQFKRIIIKFF